MDREINFHSILALEKEIEEHERAIIRLKRTRNSLLNVSTLLPPEVLGRIFSWNAIPVEDFDGLPKGSYNFLLVCHRWFEVALRTPELWSFWGNSMQDWAHRHARCKIAPVDLVFCGWATNVNHNLDDRLRTALQDRAARDAIRRVHLTGADAGVLASIISSIAAKEGEFRTNSMESLIIRNDDRNNSPDISTFFSRYHLQKLKRLCLHECPISSQDLLRSQTTALTTLELTSSKLSPILSTSISQLLSILSSTPFLQNLELSLYSITDADGDRSSIQVPLHHLKEIGLHGDFFPILRLLNQLELPGNMSNLTLVLSECSPSDLSRTLGPYLGERVRHRLSGSGLGLLVNHCPGGFSISMGDVCKRNHTEVVWLVDVLVYPSMQLEREEADRLFFDFIAHIP